LKTSSSGTGSAIEVTTPTGTTANSALSFPNEGSYCFTTNCNAGIYNAAIYNLSVQLEKNIFILVGAMFSSLLFLF